MLLGKFFTFISDYQDSTRLIFEHFKGVDHANYVFSGNHALDTFSEGLLCKSCLVQACETLVEHSFIVLVAGNGVL